MAAAEQSVDQRVALICPAPATFSEEVMAFELRYPKLLGFYPDGSDGSFVFATGNETAEQTKLIDQQTAEIVQTIDIGFRLCHPPELRLEVLLGGPKNKYKYVIIGETDVLVTTPANKIYFAFLGHNNEDVALRALRQDAFWKRSIASQHDTYHRPEKFAEPYMLYFTEFLKSK